MEKHAGIALQVSDVSGQKVLNVSNVPGDRTVGELIHSLLGQMKLPRNDAVGQPLTYHALLEREGRHLHASESLHEALMPAGDRVVLQPNIDAGSGAAASHRHGTSCAVCGRWNR